MKHGNLARYLNALTAHRHARVIYPAGRDWRQAGICFAADDTQGATLAVMALWNAGMQPRFHSVRGHVTAPFAGPGMDRKGDPR